MELCKISCHDCDASYIGQTKRQLRTRIKEHLSDIRKKTGSPSVITEHRLNHNHDFEWDNIKIIDNERSYHKRLISEIHIKKQLHGLNKYSDTGLSHILFPHPWSPSFFLTFIPSVLFFPPPFLIFFGFLLWFLSVTWYSYWLQYSELSDAFHRMNIDIVTFSTFAPIILFRSSLTILLRYVYDIDYFMHSVSIQSLIIKNRCYMQVLNSIHKFSCVR